MVDTSVFFMPRMDISGVCSKRRQAKKLHRDSLYRISFFFWYVGDSMWTFWGSLTRNALRISWGPANGRVNESVCLGQDT